MRADDLAVLLIRRKADPFRGDWALPGGFVNENEALDRAAARELQEETGLTGVKLEQLAAFGDPGRDPRGHTVTVAWMTFMVAEGKIKAGDDATEVEWHPFRTLQLEPPMLGTKTKSRKAGVRLAFDHAKIVGRAYARLCKLLDDPTRDRAFDLFPSRFTIAQMHHFYECVLGMELPMRSFRKRLLDQGLVLPATAEPATKPASQLYRWNR